MNVVRHIEDLKLIHESKKIFTRMDKWLKTKYWTLFEDTSGKKNIYIRNIYEYLGMNLDFLEPGVANINMIPYIEEILKDFTKNDDTVKKSTTPSSDHLFKTIEDKIFL